VKTIIMDQPIDNFSEDSRTEQEYCIYTAIWDGGS